MKLTHDDDGSSIGSNSNHDSTTIASTASRTEYEKPTIGAEENKRVFYSRILVGVVLVVCAAITASMAYLLTTEEEDKRFKSEFAGVASELIAVAQQAENSLVKVMDEFAIMLTSSAHATGQTWPNVTIPDFERRASANQDISGSILLAVTHAVPPTDASRAGWNQYVNENIGWLEEAASLVNSTPVDVFPVMFPQSSLSRSWRYRESARTSRLW